MNPELMILVISAASIGFVHTLVGPDHYLPFIVMARARNWSLLKTSLITMICGLGHVGSSVVLGIVGIVLGISITHLDFMEGIRGNLAGWLLVIFGFGYTIYGIWRAMKNKPHTHLHIHKNGSFHSHEHTHSEEHHHTHNKNITPWILFVIFILGPCEPLIPLIFAAHEKNNMGGAIMVSVIFSIITIITMVTIVIISFYGIKFIPLGKLEKYSHAMAGAIILISGIGIQFWNW
ncbi:hypothetical protein ACFLRZ_00635 [Bacteroidota bacterium]